MEIPPLRAATQTPLYLAKKLHCGIFLLRDQTLLQGFPPQRPGFAVLLMEFSPLGSKCEPNSVAGNFPLGGSTT